jgi:predicted XRE-type DNA-binding protein
MKKKNKPIEHEISSGNVFADLQVDRPDEALAKAKLARAICLIVEKESLTQKEAARRLGIDQPKVSMLLRGRLKDFSADRLLRFLLTLGHDVDINVHTRKARRAASLEVALV